MGSANRLASHLTLKIRDLLIYILIGVSAVVGLIWSANYNISDETFNKWGGLVLNTPVLFGFVIKQSRRYWRTKVYWIAIGSLLVVHTVVFWLILHNVHQWRLAWFLLMYPVELPFIIMVLDWTVGKHSTSSKKTRVPGRDGH